MKDIRLLGRQDVVSHKLISLNLFPDKNRILRVGGQFENSSLSYGAKHQNLLPNSHPFTKLLLKHLHKSHVHIGSHGLVATFRNQYLLLS